MLALPDLDNTALLWIPQQGDILHSCTGRSYGPVQLGLRRNEHFKVVYVQEVRHLIIIIIIIISFITVFAGVLFVHQPGANHAPRASVTQVNHSVHTLSTFLRIRTDPSMQIF